MSACSRPAQAAFRRAAGALAAALLPAAATATSVSLLNNGGFETSFRNGTFCAVLDTSFGPADYGNWAVGDAACSVAAASGITPLGGSRMLDFGTVPTGNTSSDIYQIVDVTAWAAAIDAGLATVDTSAYFNSVAGTAVGMALLRWSGAPTAFGGNGYTLLHSGFGFTTDANRATWQQFGYTGTIVPTGTRYLAFGLNSPSGAAQTYVDDASLVLHIADGQNGVPAPGTLALVLAGLSVLPAACRRRLRR